MNWYQGPTERAGVGAGVSEHKREDESDWHGVSAAKKGRRQGQAKGARPDPKCQSLSKAVTPTKADSPAQGLRAQEEQEGHPSWGVGGSPAGCQGWSTGRETCAQRAPGLGGAEAATGGRCLLSAHRQGEVTVHTGGWPCELRRVCSQDTGYERAEGPPRRTQDGTGSRSSRQVKSLKKKFT